MKKAVVIYKSKYGSTKKYAQWIAGELGADLMERDKVKLSALTKPGVNHAQTVTNILRKACSDRFWNSMPPASISKVHDFLM